MIPERFLWFPPGILTEILPETHLVIRQEITSWISIGIPREFPLGIFVGIPSKNLATWIILSSFAGYLPGTSSDFFFQKFDLDLYKSSRIPPRIPQNISTEIRSWIPLGISRRIGNPSKFPPRFLRDSYRKFFDKPQDGFLEGFLEQSLGVSVEKNPE